MKRAYETIKEKMNELDVSGIISIRDPKRVLFEETRGYRNRAEELPIELDTKFGIASGTKLFTALGIMKLVETGNISLDDTMYKYITYPFPTYDPSVTIKHLLTHTSGLPDYFDEEEEFVPLDIPWYELRKPSDYLEVMPQKDMKFTPGTSFHYNNSAFVFLAMIIEFVTGDYYDFIQTEILDVANMRDSGFYEMNQLPRNTALGYTSKKQPLKTNIFDLPIIGGGDGGMFTTVPDMHRFWDAFRRGRVVSKETVTQMISPHSASKNLSYGLGVWLEEKENQFHPLIVGQDAGVSFESGYHLDTLETYVFVSNTEHGVWPISTLYKQS